MGPVVAYFDSAELAALQDPCDRLITATAMELVAPLIIKDRAITAVAQTGAVEVIW